MRQDRGLPGSDAAQTALPKSGDERLAACYSNSDRIYGKGRLNEKVLPLPGSLSTQMRPLWASTSILVM